MPLTKSSEDKVVFVDRSTKKLLLECARIEGITPGDFVKQLMQFAREQGGLYGLVLTHSSGETSVQSVAPGSSSCGPAIDSKPELKSNPGEKSVEVVQSDIEMDGSPVDHGTSQQADSILGNKKMEE